MSKSFKLKLPLRLLASSSFPSLFHPDSITAITSIFKAELFSQTFAYISTLDDSGFVPPSPPPSDYFMPSMKILHNDVLEGSGWPKPSEGL
ncbi:hypothetical protein E2C01_012909 [Portunus trituberculatus]|uniref:Uncharacterized protein n=1 Tax=Portunus trituberculatus TaxID=210409 RepID=A0A5B7DF42_PORTR|nr:hypothetical protein [Portunus trituberculatus]